MLTSHKSRAAHTFSWIFFFKCVFVLCSEFWLYCRWYGPCFFLLSFILCRRWIDLIESLCCLRKFVCIVCQLFVVCCCLLRLLSIRMSMRTIFMWPIIFITFYSEYKIYHFRRWSQFTFTSPQGYYSTQNKIYLHFGHFHWLLIPFYAFIQHSIVGCISKSKNPKYKLYR